MSNRVESIVRHRLQAIDEAQTPVGWEEIVELLEEKNVADIHPSQRRRRGLLVFAAAVLAVVLLGVIPLLLRSTEETPPADTDTVPQTTLTVPTTTPSDLSVADLKPLPPIEPALVVDGYEPFGPVQIEYSVTESDFLPYGSLFQHDWSLPHGGLVETPSGYLALAQDPLGRVFLVSSGHDATNWVEVAARIDGDRDLTRSFGFRGRLFEAGGWYWIETLVPTRLYRSDGGIEWQEIQLPQSVNPGSIGFPLVDHRFVEFGNRLVGFGFSGEMLLVDTASGAVTTHPYPWEFPEDGFWFSSAVIDDELHVYVSSFRDQRGATHTFEEWVTSDLTDWAGPFTPSIAYSETIALGVGGDPDSGYLAAIEASGDGSSQGFYSSDGLNWRRLTVPEGALWVGLPAAAVKIGGAQGVITFQADVGLARHALRVSDDGHTWQSITLPPPESPTPADARLSVSIIDEAVYVYQQHDAQLHTWILTFGG